MSLVKNEDKVKFSKSNINMIDRFVVGFVYVLFILEAITYYSGINSSIWFTLSPAFILCVGVGLSNVIGTTDNVTESSDSELCCAKVTTK